MTLCAAGCSSLVSPENTTVEVYLMIAKAASRSFPILVILLSLTGANAQESATRGRRATNAPTGEATITVSEQFLNSFLTAIFDNLNEPSMPLTVGGAQSTTDCASEIRLKREAAGVRTAVHFENGRIVGPLAFAGAYNASLMGCVEFSGWADSEVNLEFDQRSEEHT